jgi:hypothetical protein
MTMSEIVINLAINILAGIFIFLLGLFWPVIPKSYRKVLLRRFWGKGVLGQDFAISYGALIDSRLTQQNPPPYRYVKRYHDGRAVQLVGPWGNIVGDCEIRSASYIINTLSTYRKRAVVVVDDATAFANLNRTFVALGSPSSNEITDLILREPNNTFLEFGQTGNTTFIRDRRTGREFRGFQEPVRKDYGIVLKIPNLRFPGHFFFVCAGLGEWGTSGASWYLATKWRDLQSEFGNAFGIIVEVEIGADESARRIFPEE